MSHEFPIIKSGDEAHEVLSVLGAGGSKTVLEVSIGGMKRALAIPNMVDPEEVREEKWQRTLTEPEHTAFLRDNGLLVNPYCEVEEFSVDGEATDVLAMTPFSEFPFEVYDGKDGGRTWHQGPLSHVKNYQDLLPAISGVSKDIKKLAELGVVLQRDSISFAFMPDGEMRLFLFDLDGMSIADTPEGLEERYARAVVFKLDNIVDFEQGRRFDQQGYDFMEHQRLADALISE
jgi:hypothetical protein